MASSVGKWFKLAGIVVLLVVTGVVACVLLLLKTGWLYSKIETQVEAATGYELRLADRASLTSIFPQLGVVVPSAVIRSTDPQSSVQRLRLSDVEISLPFSHLTDNPLDQLTVQAAALTVIVAGTDESSDTTSNVLPVVDVEQLIEQFRQRVSNANLSVAIDDLQVIARDSSGASSSYAAQSSRFTLTPDNLDITGLARVAGNTSRFSLQHRLSNAADGVASGLFVEITAGDDESIVTTLTSRQTIRGEEVDIEEFSVVGPHLNVSGQLNIALDKRVRVGGAVDIRQLELADIPVISARPSARGAVDKPADDVQLFTDEVVDPGQYADVDLSLSLGAVRFNNQPVISGDILISSSREHVSVQSDQLLLLGGQGQFKLHAEASDRGQKVALNAEIDAAQLSRLQITQGEKLLFSSGEADLKVSMKSAGTTQRELADALAGYFMFASSDIELSQRYAEELDRGIVSFVLKSINQFRKDDGPKPLDRRDGSLPLSCASLKLVVNRGRAEVINGLIVDLPDNVLISSGFIDLPSETLGFAFRTKKKKIFDWSALSLVKFVEVGGRLAEPRLSLDRKALLKQGLLTSSSMLVGALPPLVYRLADAGLKSGETIECTPRLN